MKIKICVLPVLLILLGVCVACSIAQKKTQDAGKANSINSQKIESPDTIGKIAKLVFDSTNYHFGSLKQGSLLKKEIYFTNPGPGDLVIELMSACECTSLDWSRLPIKPGTRSPIKIIYNSKDKIGPQIVDIEITANTNPPTTYCKFNLLVEL
ncbi:MAG: DUF1573 domain-containing protein [Saprospiraceae bacterium]|nr:DUF1573 domain-containing protein [Saprospiraceae bacterium]MBK9727495.1 DUF1573 domain-containing protein [Saprospiraceae bacterium]